MNTTFKKIGLEDYNKRFERIRRSTLLQAPYYARMCEQVYHQTTTPLLTEINGKFQAISLVQEAGLARNLIHAVILDRGPLWLNSDPSVEKLQQFFKGFNELYPLRPGRKRRILPEISNKPFYAQALLDGGIKKIKRREPYQTIWIDITTETDRLRANLKGKWRNALRKAEKSSLDIKWSNSFHDAAMILAAHHQDRKNRIYKAASLKTISVLCAKAAKENSLICGCAFIKGEFISGLIILRHGLAATYQVSWNSEKGRDVNANYKLLWESLLKMRDRGIQDFDLGGLNDREAAGLKRFKSGLGGELVTLSGQYK